MDVLETVENRPLRFAYPIAFFQGLDAFTTHHLLKAGGVEANPIGRVIIENGWLVPSKVIAATVVLAIAWWVRRYDRWTLPLQALTTFVFACYAFAMTVNSTQLIAYWLSY